MSVPTDAIYEIEFRQELIDVSRPLAIHGSVTS